MSNIETLHTIYIATMTAGIIMLVITVVLFFLFDIRHVIGKMFGFAERKEIKKLSDNTAFTGQLNSKYGQSMKGKVFTDTGSLKKKQTPAEMLGLTEPQAYAAEQTDTGAAATDVLSHAQPSDDQTTLLGTRGRPLSPGALAPAGNLQFTITRQIVMTHTNESIEVG